VAVGYRNNERGIQRALDAVGRPGSRARIPTPALLCDLDLLSDNIRMMADVTAAVGLGLRPHMKSHKSAFIARLQLEHGAIGLSCAKLAEGEVLVDRLAEDGFSGRVPVLLTSPIIGLEAAERAATLAARCDLAVVVDHPLGVGELAAAVRGAGVEITVLCDVDVGLGRTGVVGPTEATSIAGLIAGSAGLRFGGVQGYAGHVQHVSGRGERLAAARAAADRLSVVVDALEAAGHEVSLRTGGGTGSSMLDTELGVLNELQPGSYVFMDREYRDALGGDPEGRFHQSLTIATTVVSANQTGFVTVDAGLKAMATDAGVPLVVGREAGAEYCFFGDEHGLVTTGGPSPLERGDVIELVPPHCDPTVDRYDLLWLVRGDVATGTAAIDARGCSQ
jgi:D-serine deaminase-like pyridoxal phosphate-dependent protein